MHWKMSPVKIIAKWKVWSFRWLSECIRFMVWTALLQILSSSFVFPAQKEGSPTFYPHTVATIVYISSIFLRIHNMSLFHGYIFYGKSYRFTFFHTLLFVYKIPCQKNLDKSTYIIIKLFTSKCVWNCKVLLIWLIFDQQCKGCKNAMKKDLYYEL